MDCENKFVLGDCVDVLKKMPDEVADLVILDPPYWKVTKEKWDYKWRTEEEWMEWVWEWLKETDRVSQPYATFYLFGYNRNLVHLFPLMQKLGIEFRQVITIDKGLKATGGRPKNFYQMFPTASESIWFLRKDSKPIIRTLFKECQKLRGLTAKEINEKLGVKTNGGGMWTFYAGNNINAQVPTREMWEKLKEILGFELEYEKIAPIFNLERGLTDVWGDIDFYEEDRIHPTQKPYKLVERLVRASSKVGSLVLDPFAGSGTTLAVCKALRRNYFGIEVNHEYYKKAWNRIK